MLPSSLPCDAASLKNEWDLRRQIVHWIKMLEMCIRMAHSWGHKTLPLPGVESSHEGAVRGKAAVDAQLLCMESSQFPGTWAQLGPGRDLPWGWQSQNYSQLLCFTSSPQHKREGWVTPQTTLESLTTIFNFKQATHESWRLLLQTQPLGNHCLADINSPVTAKLLLRMQLFLFWVL